jgi:hypothetical protein
MIDNSMLFLLLGKDNNWLPYIMILMLIFQKWDTIESSFKKALLFGKAQYELTGKIYTNKNDAYTYGDLSPSMWALLYMINKHIKENNVSFSKAQSIELPYNQVFDENETIMVPSTRNNLYLNKDIYCSIRVIVREQGVQDESRRETKTNTIDENSITITLTTKKSIDVIMRYMKDIVATYVKFKESKDHDKLFIVKASVPKNKHEDIYSYPKLIEFKTTKTFDNLFFDRKDELIQRLDSFVNRNHYRTLGLPETLGLLFHGDPGCGKTSAIKAIANYMKMSIIIVPMHQIKTKKQLEDLFFGETINIPQDKRIYVFEEIDCNGWEQIVRDRRYIDKEPKANSNEISAIEKIADSINPDAKKSKDKDIDDKLTLGGILEVIDGLIECNGRIIIMTTNHKEFLDPALLRPGRIDMDIEFKKLRRVHIAQIYQKWYGQPLRDTNIPDYKFSQAEISQLLFKYETNPSGFIKELTKITA